jgi:hypothetical protein
MRAMVVVAVMGWAVLLLGTSGCGQPDAGGTPAVGAPDHQAALAKVLTSLDECNALLSSMKGPADVAGSKDELSVALGRVSAAQKEFSALPELTEDQAKLMNRKFGNALDARAVAFAAEVRRLRPVPSARIAERAEGGITEETAGESSFIDRAKQTFNTAIKKVKVKLQKKTAVRRGGGTSSVRG